MKTIPSKDALEVWALAQFKSEWQAQSFATTIPAGGQQMPRRHHAATFAAVIAGFMREYEADAVTAVFLLLQTTLGNASQLGAKLVKEKWLVEAEPAATADALLASLQARLSK